MTAPTDLALPTAEMVEAFQIEFARWCTGFSSRAPSASQYSVHREDAGAMDIISTHETRADAELAMDRERVTSALAAAFRASSQQPGDERIKIKRLTEELREYKEALDYWESRAIAAEARIAVLTEALKPFVFGSRTMEDILWGKLPDEASGSITAKLCDFRRARAALDATTTSRERKDVT